MISLNETDLYGPIKSFFEQIGYEVKGEVNGCDLVAKKDDDMIIVEMKRSFNLTLILQGVDRQSMTDDVYLAIPAPRNRRRARWRENVRLCRRLGLGLLTVSEARKNNAVDVVCTPAPYKPRKNTRRTASLANEFSGRSTDRNIGGSTRTKLMTAYKEESLRIAHFLQESGPSALRDVRTATALPGIPPKTGPILQKNYYGWFRRVSRGVYELTDDGNDALTKYKEVVSDMIRD